MLDPNQHATQSTYDVNGNRLSTTDPPGRRTTYSYDGLNDLTSTTDPLNVTTSLTYDGSGNLTGVSRPLTGTSQTRSSSLACGDSTHPGDATAMVVPDPTSRSALVKAGRADVAAVPSLVTTPNVKGVSELSDGQLLTAEASPA